MRSAYVSQWRMIEHTASLTAPKTIARLRVSRGGLNGPTAVVLRAMMFHVAIAWTSVLRCTRLRDSRGGVRSRVNASCPHADNPAQMTIARATCFALVVMHELIRPPYDD